MALEDLLVSISSKLNEEGFKRLDSLENKAIKKTSVLSNSLKRMFVGVIGTLAVKSIMDATVKIDTLQRSLSALAGSDAGGKAQLSFLRSESERLGQNFEIIADSYKSLFAAGLGAGWNSQDIQNVFSSVLEAGTVLGSSKQQVGGALLALEQMISKGKVSMEELRRQLGNALPGAMQIAAKAMGVTSEQLEIMLKKGVRSEDFVKKFAATLHDEYGGKAITASKSLRAELERLANAVFFLQVSLLEGDNAEGIASAIREIANIVSSPVLLKSLNGIGKLVALVAKNIKLIIGIAVIIGFKNLISTLLWLRLVFLTTTFAAGSLNAALQMMVGGRVITGLKSITAIFMAWLVPLLKIALILGLIIELVDTLRGKDTLTSEFVRNVPTLKEFTGSEKFNKGISGMQSSMPWNRNTPVLEDSGLYDKQGNRKSENNATIIINANSADPQRVANLVKSTIGDMFNNYEEVYT